MKFLATQHKLNFALKIAEKIIAKNLTLPILQNTLISCDDKKNIVYLKSTDLEVGVSVSIPAKVQSAGSEALPTKIISSFVGNLPDKNIEFSSVENKSILKCDDYKASIKGDNPEDFPIIPTTHDAKLFSLKTNSFLNGISSVVNCTSIIDVKPEISGVFVSIVDNRMIFVATDSFRLAEKNTSIENKNSYSESFIVPKKVCDLILRIFELFPNNVSLGIDNNQIIIQSKSEDSFGVEIVFVGRLIDGEYPNYQQIIPQKFEKSVNISRGELIKHVKSASLFSNKISEVTFGLDVKKQELKVTAGNNEYGDHSSTIKCVIEGGGPLEVVFNYNYLLDGLSNIESSSVYINFNGSTTPVLIKPQENTEFKYIIMPIKA